MLQNLAVEEENLPGDREAPGGGQGPREDRERAAGEAGSRAGLGQEEGDQGAEQHVNVGRQVLDVTAPVPSPRPHSSLEKEAFRSDCAGPPRAGAELADPGPAPAAILSLPVAQGPPAAVAMVPRPAGSAGHFRDGSPGRLRPVGSSCGPLSGPRLTPGLATLARNSGLWAERQREDSIFPPALAPLRFSDQQVAVVRCGGQPCPPPAPPFVLEKKLSESFSSERSRVF